MIINISVGPEFPRHDTLPAVHVMSNILKLKGKNPSGLILVPEKLIDELFRAC
jgi:hypothetical protein